MVASMARWRPWPPSAARKFEVALVVRRAEAVVVAAADAGEEEGGAAAAAAAAVAWKGVPRLGIHTLRRRVKRSCTKGEVVAEGGVVVWDEVFKSVCGLTAHRDGAFYPWKITFSVFNGLNAAAKNKASVIGAASLNLADYVSAAKEEIEICLPLLLSGSSPPDARPTLHLSLKMSEFKNFQQCPELTQICAFPAPLSPPLGDAIVRSEKDEPFTLKAGLRKVKKLSEFVSSWKTKKACRDDEGSEGKSSSRSGDTDAYPFDTDSLDDEFVGLEEAEDNKEGSGFRKSFCYGSLATANHVGGSMHFDMVMNGEHEDWIYYSNRKSDVGPLAQADEATPSIMEQSYMPSKRILLPWRSRKLAFISTKTKGEPLLRKGNGEQGGDDIDFDRRFMTSSDESLSAAKEDGSAHGSSASEFGDDDFVIGSWESKSVVSRDGHMKLTSQVFFASIDQRSERAAGESACTALVAVIADWFHSNQDIMPIKSQFDNLIREGSFEWRKLCEDQAYQERFPDKLFDLETVLEAKIRPLAVDHGRSFVGFFGMDENGGFEFLQGAMSFDGIWDEVAQGRDGCPAKGLYIISWNDHFFLLKVEPDAYYIVDTLGERLYEGCDQAYILKFDETTTINQVSGSEKLQQDGEQGSGSSTVVSEELLVCRGKESCKEYIKTFLAAIPIRELQADIKKGRMTSVPLHHRLQIELHYAKSLPQEAMSSLPAPPVSETAAAFSWPGDPEVGQEKGRPSVETAFVLSWPEMREAAVVFPSLISPVEVAVM